MPSFLSVGVSARRRPTLAPYIRWNSTTALKPHDYRHHGHGDAHEHQHPDETALADLLGMSIPMGGSRVTARLLRRCYAPT